MAAPNALTAFAAQIGKCLDDQLASFHLKRLLNGAKGTRISLDWSLRLSRPRPSSLVAGHPAPVRPGGETPAPRPWPLGR